MADRLGLDFRRLLRVAEFLTERAMTLGLDCLKTFFFKSMASLVFVTLADHFFFCVVMKRRDVGTGSRFRLPVQID